MAPRFDAAVLEPELDRIRAAGYALDSGQEPFPDICCISAPIIRSGGDVAEALSVIMTRARYERDLATLLTTIQVIALAAAEALASQQSLAVGELRAEPTVITADVAGSDAVRAAIDAAYPRIA